MEQTNVLERLRELEDAARNLSNNPNNTNAQTSVSLAREQLLGAMLSSAVDQFSPAWKQIISDLGASDLLGMALYERVQAIFNENSITPETARDGIQSLHNRLRTFSATIDKLLSAFHDLNMQTDELEPGRCELGILIPREFVHNELKGFSIELARLNKIFGVFSELVTGSREGFEIRSIASSNLSIFIYTWAKVAATVATAISSIIDAYKKMATLLKNVENLKSEGVPPEALKATEDHVNDSMDRHIGALVTELMQEYKNQGRDGRQHELQIELNMSLKKIADRIDRGFSFQVRMGVTQSDAQPKSDEALEMTDQRKLYDEIQNAAEQLSFQRTPGSPILRLSNEGGSSDTASEEGAPKS